MCIHFLTNQIGEWHKIDDAITSLELQDLQAFGHLDCVAGPAQKGGKDGVGLDLFHHIMGQIAEFDEMKPIQRQRKTPFGHPASGITDDEGEILMMLCKATSAPTLWVKPNQLTHITNCVSANKLFLNLHESR